MLEQLPGFTIDSSNVALLVGIIAAVFCLIRLISQKSVSLSKVGLVGTVFLNCQNLVRCLYLIFFTFFGQVQIEIKSHITALIFCIIVGFAYGVYALVGTIRRLNEVASS